MMKNGDAQHMLKVGIIGIGNAGNQVAKLAFENGFEDVIAINSSKKDLATVENTILTLLVGDAKGAGKDRASAKEFIKTGIRKIIGENLLDDIVGEKDVVLVVSSTGGGTGSGMAPLVRDVLSKAYPKTHFIIVGIMPPLSESLAAQQNTVEYLQELKISNPTYLLYDNGNFENKGVVSMIQNVNQEIVEDFKVIAGCYQLPTNYTSIDEKDALRILTTPGRLVVGRASGFKEKDIDVEPIEKRIVKHIKQGAQAELQYDRIVKRTGLIINLNESLYNTLDTTLPLVKESFGEPIEGFEHIALGDTTTPAVTLMMSGMSIPDDRIVKTIQRIEEVQAGLASQAASVLDAYDVSSIAEVRRDGVEKEDAPADQAQIDELLNMY